METIKDEAFEMLANTFGRGGLQFMCHASPTSKQSRDILRKELSKQILQKRIRNDSFLKDRSGRYSENELFVEFTFGLHQKRLGKRKNDIDNLIKHSLDCLKGILFKDDSQIKRICATKYILNPPSREWIGIRIMKWKNAKNNN